MAEGERVATREGTGWARRLWPLATTVVIFAAIFSRIPFSRLGEALSRADLLPFLALMAGFSLVFFTVDTLVLALAIRWFHGPLPYRDLLPVRASTYLVSLVNTQLAQGALALYLNRRFRTPLGAITGTVLTLILLEVTQLVGFATIGMLAAPGSAPVGLLAVPVVLALVWAVLVGLVRRPSHGVVASNAIAQTFRMATARQLFALLGLKSTTFHARARGARVRSRALRDSHPLVAPARLAADRLHGGSAAGHRRASRDFAGGVDLLLP